MVKDFAIIALSEIPNTPNGRGIFAAKFFAQIWHFINDIMFLPIGIGNITIWHIILYLWILYLIGILILHLVGPGGA